MDRDNQFLRWGLPGSIFCLVILSYWPLHSSFSIEIIIGEKSIGAWLFAAVIGLSIPIGFLIYQIYFFFRWWFKDDYDLINQTIDGIEDIELKLQDKGKKSFFKPSIQVRYWPFIEAYWYKELVKKDTEILISRYQHLISTFHALGASIASIILGNISSALLYFLYLDSSIIWERFFQGLTVFLIWLLILSSFYFNRLFVRKNSIVFQNQILREFQKIKD